MTKQLSKQDFAVKIGSLLTSGQAFIAQPEGPGYLQVDLSDFGSSLVRLSAFLMLNELGRHKNEQRVQALENLREMFHYQIQLKAISSLTIPKANIQTIKNGDIAVILINSTSGTPSLMAYAPLGNSPYALVIGGIPLFDWFPLDMIVQQIIVIIILLACISFLLVRPLEKRLQAVEKQIEEVAQDKELQASFPKKGNTIDNLSKTVDSMSHRIHRLITAQNDMVRAISHELRTPVTRIRFRMAMIEEANENPDIITQNQGIERDLVALEGLIDEVITFSRLQRDTPELMIEAVDVQEMYSQLTKLVKPINPQLTISLKKTNCRHVFADQRYLSRAIENLLVNAQRYANSKIELGFSCTANNQKIWVADDGPGIPEQEYETLFTPFRRIDESRNRATGGYGLGLAIVKQIAQWHNGNVTIAASEFNGAKIIIELPIYVAPSLVKT